MNFPASTTLCHNYRQISQYHLHQDNRLIAFQLNAAALSPGSLDGAVQQREYMLIGFEKKLNFVRHSDLPKTAR